jgi:DNA-binding NarL/FixJ family response regulator
LPAPFGPRKPVTLPGRHAKLTSWMPTAPKRLVTAAIMAANTQAAAATRVVALQVACAVADGATNTEIARQLYVSAATVKATISRILTKLELDNRVQIAVVVRGSRRP